MGQLRICIGTVLLVLGMPTGSLAQSTFGAVVGTVRDSSGSVVADATVTLQNVNENTTREVTTSSDGNYEALNLKPSLYKITVKRAGFQTFTVADVELQSRQTVRVDATLQVGRLELAITVESSAGVIASETQTIASSLDTSKVLNLPANFRASGSTSPYRLIGTLPGVQSDNGDAFSIQGALPSQSQTSVDGITTQHPRNNTPIREAFPSAESIAEIKVQGVGNSAEYGGVGDVTTISKSGSNVYHGSAFWYHQNRALDAKAYGSLVKPQKIANDFGFSLGGPVRIPKLYSGANRSFFFVALEDLNTRLERPFRTRSPRQLCETAISMESPIRS
jgi:hypothetical protein